jgi:ADP-ribose pyrophosphatase YjhB (NUDIX family)
LKIDDLVYLGYWDDPDRDPRAHNIAHAFYAKTVTGAPQAYIFFRFSKNTDQKFA